MGGVRELGIPSTVNSNLNEWMSLRSPDVIPVCQGRCKYRMGADENRPGNCDATWINQGKLMDPTADNDLWLKVGGGGSWSDPSAFKDYVYVCAWVHEKREAIFLFIISALDVYIILTYFLHDYTAVVRQHLPRYLLSVPYGTT